MYKFALILFAAIIGSSCTTIGSQQMSYLGNDSKTTNVVGTANHFDLLGIGISGDQYVNEYNRALKEAFEESPVNTVNIKNIKVFKEQKWGFQILGFLLSGLGYGLISEGSELGLGLSVAGLLLSSVNSYEFILIGEPE